jgi:hypothetical protein
MFVVSAGIDIFRRGRIGLLMPKCCATRVFRSLWHSYRVYIIKIHAMVVNPTKQMGCSGLDC